MKIDYTMENATDFSFAEICVIISALKARRNSFILLVKHGNVSKKYRKIYLDNARQCQNIIDKMLPGYNYYIGKYN